MNYNDLTYYFKTKSNPVSFSNFNQSLGLKRKIMDGSIDLKKARENQKQFESSLSETTRRRWEHPKMFYERREKVIKLFDGYTTIVSKAKYRAKQGEGLKILSHKQMLQRLPIALAQVKVGNTTENLLNEICQIIYSLY